VVANIGAGTGPWGVAVGYLDVDQGRRVDR
jgi:hypothetical protein